MPDWREPLPDLPLPPNGRCASAPEVELLTDTIPAVTRSRKRNACARGSSCRSPPTGRSRGRWPARPPRRSRRSAATPTIGPNVSVAAELVVGAHARDDRRVEVEAGVGVADEARARVVGGDPARAGRAVHRVVVADQPEPVLEALEEPLVDHRPVEHVLRRVADRRGLDRRRRSGEELVVDRLVDDRRAQRRAALARRAEAAEQRALDGEVEVGVGHHDHRVLAAQLQARRLEVAPAQLADPRADLARAR